MGNSPLFSLIIKATKWLVWAGFSVLPDTSPLHSQSSARSSKLAERCRASGLNELLNVVAVLTGGDPLPSLPEHPRFVLLRGALAFYYNRALSSAVFPVSHLFI